jgi:hypothetical protein
LRELEEECGIRLEPESLESALPLRLARRRTGRFLLVAPFVFRIARELPVALDPEEAVEALWISLGSLLDPARHCLASVPGLASELHYPCIPLNGAPLWGFTYRLITDWLGLTPQEPSAERVAGLVLQFLLDSGLTLQRGWREREAQVQGEIPVARLLARFSGAAGAVPSVNLLEVRPDCVRVVGLAFEEYLIRVCG